jgi:hypothetical protein
LNTGQSFKIWGNSPESRGSRFTIRGGALEIGATVQKVGGKGFQIQGSDSKNRGGINYFGARMVNIGIFV